MKFEKAKNQYENKDEPELKSASSGFSDDIERDVPEEPSGNVDLINFGETPPGLDQLKDV